MPIHVCNYTDTDPECNNFLLLINQQLTHSQDISLTKSITCDICFFDRVTNSVCPSSGFTLTLLPSFRIAVSAFCASLRRVQIRISCRHPWADETRCMRVWCRCAVVMPTLYTDRLGLLKSTANQTYRIRSNIQSPDFSMAYVARHIRPRSSG